MHQFYLYLEHAAYRKTLKQDLASAVKGTPSWRSLQRNIEDFVNFSPFLSQETRKGMTLEDLLMKVAARFDNASDYRQANQSP